MVHCINEVPVYFSICKIYEHFDGHYFDFSVLSVTHTVVSYVHKTIMKLGFSNNTNTNTYIFSNPYISDTFQELTRSHRVIF